MPSTNVSEIRNIVYYSPLKRKAKEYFLTLARKKYNTGYKSGRLDTSRLSEVIRGKYDVFKKPEEVRMIDTAVSILVDSSGSMGGNKYLQACAAAITMTEAFLAGGIKVELTAFTDFGRNSLVHHVYKSFKQSYHRENIMAQMSALSDKLASNSDGENVLLAYDSICQVDVTKRVIIVLSDGEPSGCSPTRSGRGITDQDMLACAVKHVQTDGKRTNTVIWGVGIESSAVKRFYKNNVVLNDTRNIADALLTLVKQAVVKHS